MSWHELKTIKLQARVVSTGSNSGGHLQQIEVSLASQELYRFKAPFSKFCDGQQAVVKLLTASSANLKRLNDCVSAG